MSRRKPYQFSKVSGAPMWRSLEDKVASAEERDAKASSEVEGGFVESLVPASGLTRKMAQNLTTHSNLLRDQPTLSRRGFLATTGTAAAALSLQGCMRRPEEHIVPFVDQPEYMTPGLPLHYATVTQRGSDALGLLVTAFDGRPTKIEGNPEHPSSLGATDFLAQQAIWNLYDPDRAQFPTVKAETRAKKSFEDFDAAIEAALEAHARDGGAGLRILVQPTNSPSVQRMRAAVVARFPAANIHAYAPINDDNVRAGLKAAFGQAVLPQYNLENADVVFALDSDFLATEPGCVANARAFGARRALGSAAANSMLRLYSAEATYSTTGASSDHRLRIPAQDGLRFLRVLAKALTERGVSIPAATGTAEVDPNWSTFVEALADDLAGVAGKTNASAPGRSLVVVGSRQPAAAHALAAAINAATGAAGSTVHYRQPLVDQASGIESLSELVAAKDSIRTLFVLGGNPVYDAPADIDVASLFSASDLTSFCVSTHVDETGTHAAWHAPMAHELETWGDQQALDGTVSIQQPLIAPIFGGRSELELLAKIAGVSAWRGHHVVKATFAQGREALSVDRELRRALHSGVVAAPRVAALQLTVTDAAIAALVSQNETPAAVSMDNLEVQFIQDPYLFDGRYANNLWALETPDPLSKLSWDNAAVVSPKTRDELGLRHGDIIKLSVGGRELEAPIFAVPGHADYSVTLHLGWGRTAAGRYGSVKTWAGVGPERSWTAGGFNAYVLRTAAASSFVSGVRVEKTSRHYELVTTQEHGYMEGRPIALDLSLAEYRSNPQAPSYQVVEMDSIGPLWQQVDYSRDQGTEARPLQKWGMVIDLSACTGCNACVVACQAENNIPCVGKQEVKRGRDMAWLRIDRYFVGDDANEPAIALQPIACQHCEEAPCENVCPVNATAHSPEGLNDMAYNRCIGTRYCANNCPYKVRKFNYLDWHNHLDAPWGFHGEFPETRKLGFNPNVTVRMRGVMEKCSYCVQRIQEAKHDSMRSNRPMVDGAVTSACQAACPTRAITFGDLNDPQSRVSELDRIDRRYKLLAEVGAQPRTTFLAKIRNTNPHLTPAEAAHEEAH